MATTAAVGLSFGSESCVVAVTNTSGAPQVYANADGDRITPTYIAFIDGEVLHGTAARVAFVRQPVQSVPYLLPMLSTKIVNDGSLQPKCEVEVKADPKTGEETVIFPTADAEGVLATTLPRNAGEPAAHTASELLSAFLANVKAKTIEGPCSGRAISCLCVSIPRYLDQTVVRTAIEAAGIAKEVRVIYDDVAVAVAHQIGNAGGAAIGGEASMLIDRHDVLVVDWGANVLAASALRLEGGAFRLLGHTHQFGAGGVALDKHLAKGVCAAFEKKTKIDATSNARSMRKLTYALDGVRKTLTMSTMSPINVEAFIDGMDFKDTLSRVKLDIGIRDSGLVEKLNTVLKDLVDLVDVNEALDVRHLILAGGLCRTQFIQASVKAAVEKLIPGGDDCEVYDQIPSDEAAAMGACAEAFFTTASYAALTKPQADVPAAAKLRPINAALKDVDTVEIDALECEIALFIGSSPFSKVAKPVSAEKVAEAAADTLPNPASPTVAGHMDFTKAAADKGAYEIPTDQLHSLASRGAALPVTSVLIEAAAGAAVLPMAVLASTDETSYVVPLLKKPFKLTTNNFKVLVTSEKNGSVAAVTIVEVDANTVKVAHRVEL